jgi:hypothetical protein
VSIAKKMLASMINWGGIYHMAGELPSGLLRYARNDGGVIWGKLDKSRQCRLGVASGHEFS